MASRSTVDPRAGRSEQKPWPGLLGPTPVADVERPGAGSAIMGRAVRDEEGPPRERRRARMAGFAFSRWWPPIP